MAKKGDKTRGNRRQGNSKNKTTMDEARKETTDETMHCDGGDKNTEDEKDETKEIDKKTTKTNDHDKNNDGKEDDDKDDGKEVGAADEAIGNSEKGIIDNKEHGKGKEDDNSEIDGENTLQELYAYLMKRLNAEFVEFYKKHSELYLQTFSIDKSDMTVNFDYPQGEFISSITCKQFANH